MTRKVDEIASDLDDLSINVDELKDKPGDAGRSGAVCAAAVDAIRSTATNAGSRASHFMWRRV